mmetsp:Transcript_32797/g.50072  ORF Transcript_32797/g.50072 Transcript_32797/m.50072 type:complete len:90 (-) Transcript_32797:78-347(-)
MQTTINSYSSKIQEEGQQVESLIMTKDRAYIAAGLLAQHFKDLRGAEKSRFLDSNFSKVWKDHDDPGKNYIALSDAGSLFEDLLNTADE